MRRRLGLIGFGFTFVAGGLLAGPSSTYSTAEAFQAELAEHYTEDFTSLRSDGHDWSENGGRMFTSSYDFSNGLSFTASAEHGELTFLRGATTDEHGWHGDGLGARNAGATFQIALDPEEGVNALGGYFFPFYHEPQEGQERGGGFVSGEAVMLIFSLHDGTEHIYEHQPTDHETSFYGIVTAVDNPITGLAVVVLSENGIHAGTSKVTIGIDPDAEAPENAKASKLQVVGMNGAGSCELRLIGEPGRSYRIEWSRDLEEWAELLVGTTDGEGLLMISDDDSAGESQRFYRATAQ